MGLQASQASGSKGCHLRPRDPAYHNQPVNHRRSNETTSRLLSFHFVFVRKLAVSGEATQGDGKELLLAFL